MTTLIERLQFIEQAIAFLPDQPGISGAVRNIIPLCRAELTRLSAELAEVKRTQIKFNWVNFECYVGERSVGWITESGTPGKWECGNWKGWIGTFDGEAEARAAVSTRAIEALTNGGE